MRFILTVLLIAALSFLAGIYLPLWWNFAIVAFLVAFAMRLSVSRSFLAGFAALFFLHALLTFFIDQKNEGILSSKIAQLFGLGTASFLLIVLTALLNGIIAGFAAMSGSSLRSPLRRKRI